MHKSQSMVVVAQDWQSARLWPWRTCYSTSVVDLVCVGCGKAFERSAKSHNQNVRRGMRNVYCSRSCGNSARSTQDEVPCTGCSKPVRREASHIARYGGGSFCSRRCAAQTNAMRGASHPSFAGGVRAYRAAALRQFGARCQRCGYAGDERMLDVDHKNNDRSDPSLSNLCVLCVWCHAAKTRGVDSPGAPGNMVAMV